MTRKIRVGLIAAAVALALAAPARAQEELTVGRIYLGGATITNPSGANVSIGAGTLTAGTFSGSCASCTSIPAGNLTGTITSTVQDNITRLGTIVSLPSLSVDLVPTLADTQRLGTPFKPWLRAHISEMSATVFAKSTQTLYGGWLAVTKNSGALPSSVAAAATTIDFGQAMTANQFVLIRAADNNTGAIQVEYMKVGTLVSGTTYNVTRNLDGSGANDWAAGTPYAVRGVAGDGWLELNAFDTPRMSIFTQGSAYNNSTETIRIGHLAGMPNSSSGIGAYMGDANNYLRWDGSTLKLQSATVSIDSGGIAVTPDTSLFTPTKSYKWTRLGGTVPSDCASTLSGDQFGLGAFDSALLSSVDYSEIDLHNIMVGRTSAGGCTGRAFVHLQATGWNTSAANTTSQIWIGSDPSNPLATRVELDSGTASVKVGGDNTTVGVYITGSPITLTGAVSPVAWSTGTITLANGRNDNVATGGVSFIKAIGGPTAAFSISGIAAGSDGQILTILHNSGQVLTINHADVNSSAANRIYTPGSVNLSTSASFGSVTLQYDGDIPGWIVLSIK